MTFKNARPYGEPHGRRNPLYVGKNTLPDKSKFVEARINKGMITMLDPADIDPGALQLARNARVRFDRTERRAGSILLTPVKPNSTPVIETYFFKKNNGTKYFMRFNRDKIHYRNGAVWTEIVPGIGGLLGGTDTDHFQCVTAFDRCFFANNGVNVIQEFNTIVDSFAPLGNAPQYKYITGFYNRIVGANRVGPGVADPTEVGWCADAGFTGIGLEEWDSLINETAGKSPLIDSPTDRADFISGIFGFTNVMIVLRNESIWLATKQPIPTNPFYFSNVFPGLGSDCPGSAVITLNGITWVDKRSGSVWTYQPGGVPDPIGRAIEKDLMRGLVDPDLVFASYAPVPNVYSVCIPQVVGNYVIQWDYNFRNQAWTKSEYEAITSINDPDLTEGSFISMDDLGDVSMDSLGDITMDELSPTGESAPVRVWGRNDGEIVLEDENVYRDPIVVGSTNITGKFPTELVSKTFTRPTDDLYFSEIRIEYIPLADTVLQLYYSKDGGVTFNATPKSFTPTAVMIGKPQIFRFVKQIKARRFAWKLAIDDGQVQVIGFEVHVYAGGESRV